MATSMLTMLKEKGYKLTPQRRRILEVLHNRGGRVSARDVHRIMRETSPSISLDTVYRNLRLLTEVGLVHQISLHSGAVFELAEDRSHHHHLVCIDCEEVICIPYCPDENVYVRQAAEEGFTVLGHIFEVYGRCAVCRQNETKKARLS